MVCPNIKTQDIIKGIEAGLCLLDRKLRILWMNKQHQDWFGPLRNLRGRSCYRYFEHRDHPCHGCPTLKVFKTGKTHRARRVGTTKLGVKRYYQLTVSPIKDSSSGIAYALELVQDVTRKVLLRKKEQRTREKLRESQLALSAINRKLRRKISRLEDFTRKIVKLEHLFKERCHRKASELTSVKEELKDIFKLNHIVTRELDSAKVFSLVTRLTCSLMHTHACILRFYNEEDKTLIASSTYGFSDGLVDKMMVVKMGESICGRVAKSKKAIVVKDIEKEPRLMSPQVLAKEGFHSLICVPVLFQHKIMGVLSTFSKSKTNFPKEDISVLEVFASQAAAAVYEAKYYENTYLNYFNTIHALVLTIEARDPYTRGHTERVTNYSLQVARVLGLSMKEQELLRYASEIHDLGKIAIPDSVLNKPGRLTPEERAVVELHPVRGAEMLEPLDFLKMAIPIVRHHHERYDGTGYPDGLEKQGIPFMARILACADSFDAMTSDRPYRKRRLTTEEALYEIKINSGSQFDPHIADLFVKTLCQQNPASAKNYSK
ncbi:MAG: GAF domain-containing protein [Candidatus Omnitrophica bacterium]|nr:GAF domain-containing protein [Candidatus Omnitrophota bacterium]